MQIHIPEQSIIMQAIVPEKPPVPDGERVFMPGTYAIVKVDTITKTLSIEPIGVQVVGLALEIDGAVFAHYHIPPVLLIEPGETPEPPEEPTPPEEPEPPTPPVQPLWSGTVVAPAGLNVRVGTSTSAPIVRKIPSGTRVDIYQVHHAEGFMWGKIHVSAHEWTAVAQGAVVYIRPD